MSHHRQQSLQPDLYGPRKTKGGSHDDESKRRKLIRWLKKTVGVKEEPLDMRRWPEPTPSQSSIHDTGRTYPSTAEYPRRYSFESDCLSSGADTQQEPHTIHVNTQQQRSGGGSYASSSSRSTVTSSDLYSSGASIYEYNHQMPQSRKPKPASSIHNNTTHVLIIGAGIGGLCLAQGLKKFGIPFTVFERDPTPNYRTQGYRLRINGSGYEALKVNLSRENFDVFVQATGRFLPGFMYVDAESGGAAPDSVKFAHRSSAMDHVFSIDRAMLRSLLLSDLVEGSEIQYGMAFTQYQVMPNGRVQVEFENMRRAEGSVLVGADGTTSRVRRQYIPRHITLLDTDSAAIYGKTPITPEIERYFATVSTTLITSQHPRMALVIEPRCGSSENMDEYVASTGGMRNPVNAELPDLQNYLCWVLMARADLFHLRPNTTVHDLYAMSPEEVAELSIEMASSWCPRVRALLERQDPEWCSYLRISSMSPEMKRWQSSTVTLLGDAVHTMVPAGIGCNTAMQDARILVKMFVEHGVNVDAIAMYERAMREHGCESINISMDAGERMFGLAHYQEMRPVMY